MRSVKKTWSINDTIFVRSKNETPRGYIIRYYMDLLSKKTCSIILKDIIKVCVCAHAHARVFGSLFVIANRTSLFSACIVLSLKQQLQPAVHCSVNGPPEITSRACANDVATRQALSARLGHYYESWLLLLYPETLRYRTWINSKPISYKKFIRT